MTRVVRLLAATVMAVWAAICPSADAQADGSFWWLQKETTTPPPVTAPPPPPPTNTTTPEIVYCECVKYYLCIDNVISTSGVGVIDIRMSTAARPPRVTNVERCPDDLDVCCGLPPSETTTTLTTPTLTTPKPTLPPDTPCECVPFLNCTAERLVSDGRGNTTLEVLGIGYSHSKCPQAFAVCCALHPTTPPPLTTTTTDTCQCVDFFQCDDQGYIITSGEGLIDLRTRIRSRIGSFPAGQCDDPSLVCCRPPTQPGTSHTTPLVNTTTPLPFTTTTTTTTPPPTTTQQPIINCGTRNSDGVRARILGFQDGESQFGEFPWVAAILSLETLMGMTIRRFVGGGTLIHPRVVVTAAHKVLGHNASQMVVRLGEWDTQSELEPYLHQDVAVEDVVLHPHFNHNSLYHDVALLFLKEEPELTSHVNTICMAQELSMVDPSACVINGWGLDGFENGEYQKIMKSLTIPLVKHTDCVKSLRTTRLGRFFRLHSSFTCAGGERDKDACRGDGGGPLACPRKEDPKRYLLVGITAWGIGCGVDGIPGVYANIPQHYNWITKLTDARFPTTTTSTTTPTPFTTTNPYENLQDDPKSNINTLDSDCEIDLLGFMLASLNKEEIDDNSEWSEYEGRSDVGQTERERQREERERQREAQLEEKERQREERRRLHEERQRERQAAKEERKRLQEERKRERQAAKEERVRLQQERQRERQEARAERKWNRRF